jgi:hypothetical protein
MTLNNREVESFSVHFKLLSRGIVEMMVMALGEKC